MKLKKRETKTIPPISHTVHTFKNNSVTIYLVWNVVIFRTSLYQLSKSIGLSYSLDP